MNQEIDYILFNLQHSKITDVDVLRDSFNGFIKTCEEQKKETSLLATKLFDDEESFMNFFELKSTIKDNLTKSIKRAVCQFMKDFIKKFPEFIGHYFVVVFVILLDKARLAFQKRVIY